MIESRHRHLCDAFIKVSDDPWAGTYCKLFEGHDGNHSPLYADERDARVPTARASL